MLKKSPAQIAALIDHTLLKATATEAEITRLCDDANVHAFYSVCVNAFWLPLVRERLRGPCLPISVVGFPLGAGTELAKAFETENALKLGAQEIDMVINLGALKSQAFKAVESDIRRVTEMCGTLPVKVILENCYLGDDEIVTACKIAVQAGAKFVKTSTGFGPQGATVQAVELMRKTVGPNIGVKASGGVRNFSDFSRMVDAGASRVGCSASVAILEESRNV